MVQSWWVALLLEMVVQQLMAHDREFDQLSGTA